MHVLIADADTTFANAARLALRSSALAVDVVLDGEDAIERAAEVPYSAVVLDLALTGASDGGILARMRQKGQGAPILALVSDPAPEARIRALQFGADDCLVKPVLLAELVARVHALARSSGRKTGDCLEVEDLVLHCARRRAFRAGQALSLTDREFSALEHLVRAHGRPVSGEEMLETIWRGKSPPRENFISVLMMRLRKKVDEGTPKKLVRTLRGKGYIIAPAE